MGPARWPPARPGKGCASGLPRNGGGAPAFASAGSQQRGVPRHSPHCIFIRPKQRHRPRHFHFYPDGLKGGTTPVEQQFLGKRGKSVKRMRFAPTEKAYAIGLKLQGS